MANPEHVEIVKAGKEAIDAWRKERPVEKLDLRGANLIRANFERADLWRAALERADLELANLTDSNLSQANLERANLSEANLERANLEHANLRGANLSRADLRDVNFMWAEVAATLFADVDLSSALHIDNVDHAAPTTIGIDTLLKSGGKLPDLFLRGCGVNPLLQQVIVGEEPARTDAYYELVSTRGILQTCFLSYAEADRGAFVDQLVRALRDSSVSYWYAREHGTRGRKIEEQIDQQIELMDRVLVICSKASIESDWCLFEIDRARELQKKRGETVLFPVAMDNALWEWKSPRATALMDVLAADFREATEGDAFDAEFEKLVAGLRKAGVETS